MTKLSSAPNFNLAGRSSLTTYPSDKCKKPQVDAEFLRKKFAACAEPAVCFWGKFEKHQF